MRKYTKILSISDIHNENLKYLRIFLENNRRTKKTLVQYENSLRNFLLWYAGNCNNKHLKNITTTDLLLYQHYLKVERNLKGNSINFKRNALSTFYSFLITYFPDVFPIHILDVFKEVPRASVDFKNRKTSKVTANEFKTLCTILGNNKNYEMILFLKLIYNYQLKIIEIRNLKRDLIYIPRNQKGLYPVYIEGRSKPVYFNKQMMNEIKLYIKDREDDLPYIFYKVHDGVITRPHISTFSYWITNTISGILGRKLTVYDLYAKTDKRKKL